MSESISLGVMLYGGKRTANEGIWCLRLNVTDTLSDVHSLHGFPANSYPPRLISARFSIQGTYASVYKRRKTHMIRPQNKRNAKRVRGGLAGDGKRQDLESKLNIPNRHVIDLHGTSWWRTIGEHFRSSKHVVIGTPDFTVHEQLSMRVWYWFFGPPGGTFYCSFLFSLGYLPAVEVCKWTRFRWATVCDKTVRKIEVWELLSQILLHKTVPLVNGSGWGPTE